MRRKKGASVSLMLAGTLGLALIAGGCGNGDDGQNAASPSPGGSVVQKSGGKITASIFDRGAVPADEGTYEENRWTKWMNEQSGVNVSWVPITRSQEFDKYNMLIASGQAPDLITSYDRNMLARFIQQGVAQPLDDIIDQYSTSYKKYIADHPELKPYVTFDGKTYAIASLRPTRAQTQIWIRQDWLDKLGLPMPTTVDELIEVARAFRDKDPDGNNKNDTIPISISIAYGAIVDDWYMARSGDWTIEDGKATLGFFTDRFKDDLAFRKLAYDENLIDREFATDQTWTRQKQFWLTGKSGILFGYASTAADGPTADFFKANPDAVVAAVPPLATKYGTNGYQKEVPNYLLTLFNKDMKDPQAAMKFVDWMLDDGWKTLTYGVEGENYELKDNLPVMINNDVSNKILSFAGEYRIVTQDELTPESLLVKAGDDPNQQKANKLYGDAIKLSEGTVYRKDFPYPPPVPEYQDIASQFQKKWEEVITQATMGGKSKTPDWAVSQIRKDWEALGGKEVEQKVQAWYDANKDSLQ